MDSLIGWFILLAIAFAVVSFIITVMVTYWFVIAAVTALIAGIKLYPTRIKPWLEEVKVQLAIKKADAALKKSGQLLAGWEDYITVNKLLPPLVQQHNAPHYYDIIAYVRDGDIKREVYFVFDKNRMMLQDMAKDCQTFSKKTTISAVTQSKITALWQELQLINTNIMAEIMNHAQTIDQEYLADSREERAIMDEIIAEKKH